MTREEAAAKAAMQRDSGQEDWPTLAEIQDRGTSWMKVDTVEELKDLYAEECRPVLAAADAHDDANGIHRISLDDKTVERAAKALMHIDGYGWLTEPSEHHRKIARAVLIAAIEGDE